ncbi:MAG: sigma 54-interacting transcriptional regulator [Firmicutes bacterium]|nr:sigma 54-interacting transcriptional regulator [Bacillota bacterium]
MTKEQLQDKLDYVMRCAFESLSGAKIIVDENGIVLYASKFHYKYLGIEKEEDLIGKYVCDVIPGTRMHIVVETETAEYGYIFRFVHKKTKEVMPVVCNRVPIYDANNKLVGAMSETIFPQGMEAVLALAKEVERINDKRNASSFIGESKRIEDYVIGSSQAMKDLRQMISQCANFPLPVLITGETGTGKEVFASAFHEFSDRRKNNFVKINCAAIPNELLESELFGYESGAFSGASAGGKVGKFEYAQNGTILLDEIGDMPFNLQAKLLRAIQEKEFEKVGGLKSIPFNARVVCTTNQNMADLIANQKFRQDLYYRINVIEMVIPPLRSRKEDIKPLCRHFIDKINRENGLSIVDISASALELLESYDWPGNVRELRHIVEHACFLLGAGILEREHFKHLELKIGSQQPQEFMSSQGQEERFFESLDEARAFAEMEEIKKALERTKGNKSQAAKLLKIDRTILYDKMKKYNIG